MSSKDSHRLTNKDPMSRSGSSSKDPVSPAVAIAVPITRDADVSSTSNPIFGKRPSSAGSPNPSNFSSNSPSNARSAGGEAAAKLPRKSASNLTISKPEIDRAFVFARCSDPGATQRLQQAVENGSHLAQAYMSILYSKGTQIIPKDEKKADYCAQRSWAWLQTEAAKGCPYSQFNVGFCLLDGRGCAKNETEAVNYFKMAADQGHAGAQSNLAVLYQNGIGTRKNDQVAAKYFKMAADQGHAVAQCNLGVCYEQGKGVGKDAAEAARYYGLSAEQGYAGGQNGLGWCYYNGTGVAKDEGEAVRYFQMAADQGHAGGQYNLGRCHKKGIGLPRNLKEARGYYMLAAAQGHADAQNKLDRMK